MAETLCEFLFGFLFFGKPLEVCPGGLAGPADFFKQFVGRGEARGVLGGRFDRLAKMGFGFGSAVLIQHLLGPDQRPGEFLGVLAALFLMAQGKQDHQNHQCGQ